MPLQNGGPLPKAFITKAKAKSLFTNIWTHDYAERLRMRRVGQAKADNLGDDYNVGTYPSELLIKKGTGLKGLITVGIMGASLLGGGIAGGAYLADLLKVKETIEKVTTKVIDYDVEMDVLPPE